MHKILLILLCISLGLHAQTHLANQYVAEHNDSTYIKFRPDSSFYYRYSYDLMQNRDTGKYKMVGDTIFLIYTPFVTLEDYLTAKGFRPDTLFVKGDKLYLVRNSKIINKPDPTPLTFKPPHAWGYRRKYYLFGSYIPKKRSIYYMIDAHHISSKQ